MESMQNLTAFENNEKPIIDLLDRHLASAVDLQLRLRSALWNFEDLRLAETRELGTAASEIEQFLHPHRRTALRARHRCANDSTKAASTLFPRSLSARYRRRRGLHLSH